jgi:hypothetical protein
MNRRWKIAIALVVTIGFLFAQQPIQLQTVNGGGNVLLGHGTAAGALRVELPTDGTGVVALASGSVTNPEPQSTSAYAFTSFDLAATAATNVDASAGNVWGMYGYNPNATTCFLQFYNSASASLGTSALHPFGVLAGGTFTITPGAMALYNFSTAISTGQTTTATGSTPCSSAMNVTIFYK